jgi:hypothetical protein
MAFNLTNLVGVAHLNNLQDEPLVVDYSTADNIATIEGSGYFNGGIDKLRRGDMLRVTAGDGKGFYIIENANYPSSVSVGLWKLASVSSFAIL